MAARKPKAQPFGMLIMTGGVESILARLFRVILQDLNVSVDRYDALMIRYIQKAHLDKNRLSRADARVGLSKELLKDRMTWKTFIKGLDFINVTSFEIGFIVNYADGTAGRYTLQVHRDMLLDEGSVLSKVFQMIRADRVSSKEVHAAFVKKYIANFKLTASKAEQSATKASLNKELLKPSISWKTFVKGLAYVDANRFTINLNICRCNARITGHYIVVSLSDYEDGATAEGETLDD